MYIMVHNLGIQLYLILVYNHISSCLAACARYYRSLYEDHKRAASGSKEKHRMTQRCLGRKKTVRITLHDRSSRL